MENSAAENMKRKLEEKRKKILEKALDEEYKNVDNEFVDVEEIKFYYNENNSLEELKWIGLTLFYDMKLKKGTTTLYSTHYMTASVKPEKDDNSENSDDSEKMKLFQLFIEACRDHINGNERGLISTSKCFGIDLFKYMHMNENEKVNVDILYQVPFNFIRYDNHDLSLQEYLQDKSLLKNLQFCLDFSSPRNDNVKNSKRWLKCFLSRYIISKSEYQKEIKSVVEFLKKILEKETEKGDFANISINLQEQAIILVEYLLMAEQEKRSEKGISSRISPIADKEVILSDKFWECQQFSGEIEPKEGRGYHFELAEDEYCDLIFFYFKKYREEKEQKKDFKERYEETWKNKIENCTLEWIKPFIADDKIKEESENVERVMKKFKEYYSRQLDVEKPKESTKFILLCIDWEKESIPNKWTKVYKKNAQKDEHNNAFNIYKEICKGIATNESIEGDIYENR